MKKLMIAACFATAIAGVGFAAQAHPAEPTPLTHRPGINPTPPECEPTDGWQTCFWKRMGTNSSR